MVKKSELGRMIAITIVCVILGFAISLQLRSVKILNTSNTGLQRAEQLQKDLSQERTKNEELYQQLLQIKGELDNYRSQAEKSGSVSEVLMKQLSNAEFLAGLTDITGPGVVITLKDAKENVQGAPAENYILHDGDIRDILNELLASGAEAISINNERVVSTTSIRCVGPTVTVNNTRYAAPFVIKAIGEPKTLEAGLILKGGVVDMLRMFDIIVDIQTSDKVDIGAYKGIANFKYAQPVKKGAAG